ncbi:MAG TPA: hypothetical protein VMF58_11985, partial [Rhizomicrobium sp.]|nr:hypothetical protein [Rhizomicrobium sp.]
MRGFGLAIFAVIFGAAVAHAADDTPTPLPTPAIREFDIPTIERLGREMYDQDQLAWKATDVLFTKHKKDELVAQKEHGWIVDSFPDHRDVVRFVRDTDAGPVPAYDVTFTAGQPSGYAEPQGETLNSEELAQYNARWTAIKNVDRRCAETINTVALKDPESDGWLVWAMAATTKPDVMVVGGHFRFTISKDGKSVIRKDALSRGCLMFSKPGPKNGQEVMGAFVGHLVSLNPIETYVFDSISYHQKFDVATLDGKAWKIVEGHVELINMDMPDPDGSMAEMLMGMNEKCFAVVQSGDAKYQTVSISSVLQATQKKGPYTPDASSSGTLKLIGCGRPD